MLLDIGKAIQKITLKHLAGQHNQKRHGWRYGNLRGVKRSMRGETDSTQGTNAGDERTAYAVSYRKRQGMTNERAVQEIITRIERKIRTLPTERLILIDRNTGKTLFDKGGNERSVVLDEKEHDRVKEMASKSNIVMTHNHPSSVKGTRGTIETMGTSFSRDDIVFGAELNLSEIRAVSADGSVFVMKRPSSGWLGPELISTAYNFANNKVYSLFSSRINAGTMSIAEGNQKHSATVMDEFMKMWEKSYTTDFVPKYYKEELPKAYQRR